MHREKEMQLYCGDGPNSYRVRIFMAEKGIEVPQVRIDFEKREHRSAEFLKLNSLLPDSGACPRRRHGDYR